LKKLIYEIERFLPAMSLTPTALLSWTSGGIESASLRKYNKI
jgi:hypothetical protein